MEKPRTYDPLCYRSPLSDSFKKLEELLLHLRGRCDFEKKEETKGGRSFIVAESCAMLFGFKAAVKRLLPAMVSC